MRPLSKTTLYIGILSLLSGGVLFWLGGQKKKYQVDTTIQAPRKAVFRHLTEPDLIRVWREDIKSIEPIREGEPDQPDPTQNRSESGKKQPLEKKADGFSNTPLVRGQRLEGARARFVYESDGKETEFEEEVVTSQQDSRLVVISDNSMLQNRIDYSLFDSATSEHTNLRLIFQVKYKGFFRFAGPFMGRSLQQKLEDDIQLLKLAVEREQAVAKSQNADQDRPANRPTATTKKSGTPDK